MSNEKLPPFFYEIFHESLPRLGPGDDASTLRAIKTLLPLMESGSHELRILDLGCGNGAQTIPLATHTNGTITAVDYHQPFLQELQRRATSRGLSHRIKTLLVDMRSPNVDLGTFDLIWSESALFVMGFRNGLKACYDLLVPGGFLAVSEMCWLRPDPPEECRSYLDRVYPDIATVEDTIAAMRGCGYEIVDHFTLPESAWWDEMYTPIEARLRAFRENYAGDPDKEELLDSVQMEIDMYRTYSSYYGYAFYLLRRP